MLRRDSGIKFDHAGRTCFIFGLICFRPSLFETSVFAACNPDTQADLRFPALS